MPFVFSGDWIPTPKQYPPVKIFREKRNGAYVTLIKHVPLEDRELKLFLSELKKRLATGGSLKEERIEIQGDKVNEVKKIIHEKGWKYS